MNFSLSQVLHDWRNNVNTDYWYNKLMENHSLINTEVINLLYKDKLTQEDIQFLHEILVISNVIYNYSNTDNMLIENAIYDRLIELHKLYTGKNVIGAFPVQFSDIKEKQIEKELVRGMTYLTSEDDECMYMNSFYFNDLYKSAPFDPRVSLMPGMVYERTVSKRLRNTAHANPALVGTLDKCKFCLVTQAEKLDPNLLKDPTVKIVERDFFAKHVYDGIIDPHQNIDICCELKYDGVSIEATIFNGRIVRAGTRGDTDADLASDLTPILEGYIFPRMINLDREINVKFEAIMTYYNLQRYSEIKGRDFINGRTAIISWLGSSDAYMYRELVTLIPLATDLTEEDGSPIDRLVEIEFMNRYLTRTELLRYSVISGNLTSVLYSIYKYAQEAEYMKKLIPFMYDGIVISYLDPNIRARLGREDFVNKYTIALKFEPLKKRTRFDHFTYEVGQNGVITPRIWFDPVEFFGSIHPKTSGHSYGRFKALSLRKDDLIDVTYRNDVMPYVTKADCTENDNNTNPIIEFPTECPECGHLLSFTESSASCTNPNCKGMLKKRMTNMLAKLQFSGFAEETVESLGVYTFHQFMELKLENVRHLGDLTSKELINQIEYLKSKPVYDWFIIGALGFNNCAGAVWKKIFSVISLNSFVNLCDLYFNQGDNSIITILTEIPGIGNKIVETILGQYQSYKNDIEYISTHMNVIDSFSTDSVKIRFTGFRDKELVEELLKRGADAGEGSVTKDTNYLVVPYDGYSAGRKCATAIKYNVPIISKQELINNIDKYTN